MGLIPQCDVCDPEYRFEMFTQRTKGEYLGRERFNPTSVSRYNYRGLVSQVSQREHWTSSCPLCYTEMRGSFPHFDHGVGDEHLHEQH
jgi:hypothetical protein